MLKDLTNAWKNKKKKKTLILVNYLMQEQKLIFKSLLFSFLH